ncbi:uncharacterized protein LOC142178446 [Nicotiana tabacum]|uniref:Uncharacterized protein LOC142178446 n=1 Tax=Nicotiana tabacum TaxID=4097 RepID=A0AC58U3L4_TOBAC
MLMSLSTRNKIGFTDGSCPRPSVTSPLYKAWDRCNNLVRTWILTALTMQIKNSVLHSKSAKDMWDDLRDKYGQPNGAQIYQLKKDLVGVTQGNSDIAIYYSRLKKLWDELSIFNSFMTCYYCDCVCKCGAKGHNAGMIESDKVYQFLMGLNESYTASRGNILMMTPLPSLSETYSLLVHEEKHREVQASVFFITAVAFLIAGSNNMQQQPQTQNQGFNHNQNRNMNFRNSNNGGKFNIDFKAGQKYVGDGRKNTIFCNYYKKSGHLIDRCYKLHGTGSEPGQSTVYGGAITKEQMSQLMQLLQNVVVGSQGSSLPEGIGSANLAGTFSEEATGNVWEPYNTATHSGNRYFLTLVDDYSRSTWTYLLSIKSNAFTALKSFILIVETQFNYRVKIVRSDNALELGLSHKSSSFFLSNGTLHQTSYVETSRMELFPNSVLQGKTPHELLFGTPPSYDHLTAFESSSLPMPTSSFSSSSLPTGSSSPPPLSPSSSNVPQLTPTHDPTPSIASSSILIVLPLRKSFRTHQRPGYLQDFMCNSTYISCPSFSSVLLDLLTPI